LLANHFYLPTLPTRRSSDLEPPARKGLSTFAQRSCSHGFSFPSSNASENQKSSIFGSKGMTSPSGPHPGSVSQPGWLVTCSATRSEEHTSELQSREKLVIRL